MISLFLDNILLHEFLDETIILLNKAFRDIYFMYFQLS
jgi:hypothetical protein